MLPRAGSSTIGARFRGWGGLGRRSAVVKVGAIVGKVAGLVATGLARAVALISRSEVLHGAAVTVATWGLRGARAAEVGAEKARLTAADILSEARERIGD